MWRPGPTELVIIMGIVLIIFGPGKLPEAGRAIGRAIGEFRKNSNPTKDDESGEGGSEKTSA